MKKDIFNGKIKKEYFSYILAYMIFFVLLFVGVGALCVYASIWGMTTNTSGERLLIASFGAIAFLLAGIYVFLELLVIRNFPKHEKIRRSLFNSDIYFTDSTSTEYFGGSRTLRGRRNKAAFEMVTAFAEAEKIMGNKKPVRYTVYCALSLFMSLLGLSFLFAMIPLFENGTIFPNMSDDVFLLCYISVALVCIALAFFFLSRAYNVALWAPLENLEQYCALQDLLVDIAVRKNNKKRKFWYDENQLDKIEDLVHSANKNYKVELQRKGSKIVSFQVIDNSNCRVVFNGLFR